MRFFFSRKTLYSCCQEIINSAMSAKLYILIVLFVSLNQHFSPYLKLNFVNLRKQKMFFLTIQFALTIVTFLKPKATMIKS